MTAAALAAPPAPPAPPAGMPVSGGFAPQAAQPDNGLGGGYVMPAQPAPAAQRPQWGQFFPQATALAAPPAPPTPPPAAWQAPPAPGQAAPSGQQPMLADPLQRPPAAATQFNDGLALAGPAAGGPPPAALAAPAGAPLAAAAPAGVGTPQPPAPPPTAIRDRLAGQGLPVGHYASDEQLLADLGSTLSQVQQLQQLAGYGRQYLAQQSQQPPASPPAPAPAPAAGPATPSATTPQRPPAPEWREEWASLVRLDERTGRFVPVDPLAVNPLIVERANEYAAWRRQRAEAMIRDPIGTLRAEGLDDILQQERERIVQELRQQALEEQQAQEAQRLQEQFLNENRAAFFQLDPIGQPVINPLTGQPVITPRGHAAQQHAAQYSQAFAARYGHEPHPADVIQHVRQALAADEARGLFGPPGQPPAGSGLLPGTGALPLAGVGGAPTQQPGQIQQALLATQQAAQQRMQAMNGAHYQPNQMGTIAAAAQQPEFAQNPHESFRDTLVKSAIRRGMLHPNYQ